MSGLYFGWVTCVGNILDVMCQIEDELAIFFVLYSGIFGHVRVTGGTYMMRKRDTVETINHQTSYIPHFKI